MYIAIVCLLCDWYCYLLFQPMRVDNAWKVVRSCEQYYTASWEVRMTVPYTLSTSNMLFYLLNFISSSTFACLSTIQSKLIVKLYNVWFRTYNMIRESHPQWEKYQKNCTFCLYCLLDISCANVINLLHYIYSPMVVRILLLRVVWSFL